MSRIIIKKGGKTEYINLNKDTMSTCQIEDELSITPEQLKGLEEKDIIEPIAKTNKFNLYLKSRRRKWIKKN